MFCAISGEVPQQPVVSRSTGALYEKRLVEKYLREEGKCPVTGAEMTEEDLIEVKANKAVRPRPIAGTSIPGLLATFQNEWDELMLETFTLKQHLDSTRQELAQSLYQHDAACRVIARLMVERDEARGALAALQQHGAVQAAAGQPRNGSQPVYQPMDVTGGVAEDGEEGAGAGAGEEAQGGNLPAEVLEEVLAKCTELSGARRGRSKAASAAAGGTRAVLEGLQLVCSLTPHKADSSSAVTCVAARSDFPTSLTTDAAESDGVHGAVLSGGTDKSVVLSAQDGGKALAKLQGHSKRVSAVSFLPDSTALLSASADKTVKVWSVNSSSSSKAVASRYKTSWTYEGHASEVTGFALQPTGNYVASVGSDGEWHFLDIARGACLKEVSRPEGQSDQQQAQEGCASCAFHPDGLILAVGRAGGAVDVWDVREMARVQRMQVAGAGAAHSLCFSENGYHLASASAGGAVELWDLRKLSCVKSLDVSASSVAFDQSGLFLAVGGGGEGGTQVQVRAVKEWSSCWEQGAVHSKAVAGVCWSQGAGATDRPVLISCGADRSIKLFAPPAKGTEED